jgi:hypothetical protein
MAFYLVGSQKNRRQDRQRYEEAQRRNAGGLAAGSFPGIARVEE